MVKILVIGDRLSGKATFVGLLYATQVSSGSDLADQFRFHVPYESLNAISYAFQQLMSGNFPDPMTKEGMRAITFQVEYSGTEGGAFSRIRTGRAAEAPTVNIVLFGSADDSFSNLLAGSRVEDERWTDVYDAEVLLLVVDSVNLGVKDDSKGEPKKAGPMERFDRALSLILPLVRRASEPEVRKRIHPIFLFTKFDRIPFDVVKGFNLPARPPSIAESRARVAYAESLLKPNLPRTMAELRIRERDSVKFSAPSSYFLWVRTKAVPGQPEKIEFARGQDGRWQPIYSRDEYVSLLAHLGKILEGRR